MTTNQKREAMEKRYYKLIKAGKHEEAAKLMKKMISLDVENLKKRLG